MRWSGCLYHKAVRGATRASSLLFGSASCAVVHRHPFASGVGVTVVKTVAADLVVQLAVERRPWDSKRTSLFAFFGLAYQGCAQYFIINTLLEGLFPGRTARCVLAKIASVTMVADPFLFLPAFYIFKESIARERVDVDTISHALHKQRENFVADVRNSLMLWIPGHCVTYGVLTPPLRLPWIACMSFVYVTILSFARGSIPERGSARADGKTTPNSPQLRRLNSVGLPAVEDAHNDISTSQGDRTSATPPYCSHQST